MSDRVREALRRLVDYAVYVDNGYCSVCHGHWPNHDVGCAGAEAFAALSTPAAPTLAAATPGEPKWPEDMARSVERMLAKFDDEDRQTFNALIKMARCPTPTPETVERVARALFGFRNRNTLLASWDEAPDWIRDGYREMALTALRAVGEGA